MTEIVADRSRRTNPLISDFTMYRRWILALSLVTLPVGVGCNSESEPEWFEMPQPKIVDAHQDASFVAFTFGPDAAMTDFDCAIGPRIEEYQTIHGSRIRVEGTLHVICEGNKVLGASLLGESSKPFRIGVSGFKKIPLDLDGRRVVMEGRLIRKSYPPKLRKLYHSRYKRLPQNDWPVGYFYNLVETSFEAIEPSAYSRSYEVTPL